MAGSCPISFYDGLVRFMATDPGHVGPLNLGNPSEFSILDLAETVIRLTRSSSRIVHRPLPTDDPRQRSPDITKAKALIDWEPKVALEDGLARTIAYFREFVR